MINKKLIVFPIHEKVVLNLVFQSRRIYWGICIPLSAARSKAVTWLSGLCLPSSTITSTHQLSTDCLLIHLLSPFSYLPHSQESLSTDVQQISRGQVCSHFVQWHQTIFLALSNSDCPRYPVLRCWLAFTSQKSSPVYLYCVFCIRICIWRQC